MMEYSNWKDSEINKDQTSYKSMNASQKSKWFKAFWREFVANEYWEKIKEATFDSNDKFEDVFNYICIIVQPDLAKKWMRNRIYLKFMTLFYDWVYKYSHRKISKLFSDPILRFLFEDYIKSGMVYEMIDSDVTLSRNKEMYKMTVEIFTKSFERGEYSLLKK